MRSLRSRKWFKNPLFWILLLVGVWRAALFFSIPPLISNDSVSYYAVSQNLFSGATDTNYDAWISPGYPLFLKMIFIFFGTGAQPVILVQTILGIAAVFLYARLAEKTFGRVSAIAVALYLGLHPALIVYEHAMLSETLALFLQACALYAVILAMDTELQRRSLLYSIVAGLFLSLTALTRPAMFILIVGTSLFGFLLVSKYLIARHSSQMIVGVRAILPAVLISLVFVSPWLLNNWTLHHKVGLSGVSNIARLVFGIGSGFLPFNSPDLLAVVPNLPERCTASLATCTFEPINAVRAQGKSEYEIDDWAGSVVNQHIRENPLRYVQFLVLVGFQQFGWIEGRVREVDNTVLQVARYPNEYLGSVSAIIRDFPQMQPFVLADQFGPPGALAVWTYKHIWSWRHPFLGIMFFLGLPWLPKSSPGFYLVLMVSVYTLFLVLLLAPVDRYMLLEEPLLFMIGCAGLSEIVHRLLPRMRQGYEFTRFP